jgi:cytochrome oxidase assembly protein ShyY1
LLCVLLPFVLALWQGQRGMDKLPLEQALAMRQVQAPASTLPLQGAANLARYRLQGVRAAGLPILLANSLLDGMPGQRVLQPLRLADGSLILADLGWRAANRPLPDLVLPAQLPGQWWPWHGRLTLPGARLGTAGEVDAVDMAALTRRYPGHWHAGVFIAQPPLSGLQPWPLQPPLSAQRHFAYAVQWLLLGLCLLWRWRRSGA